MVNHYAIVPAAGSGARFGGELPKQYRLLAGRPLIFHALSTLCRCPWIDRVWVVLAADDAHWCDTDWSVLGPKLESVFCGGETRAASVRNGLRAAETALDDDDWVLVHDAARPCLSQTHLQSMIDELGDDPVGGILAIPVADTLKRADADGRIEATPSRDRLWQAQTPQMFRAGILRDALDRAPQVTDEAGAVEALGLRPRLVAGDASNFKVTYAADLALAELVLRSRRE